MALPFLASLLIGVGLMVLGYMLMPKPKQPKPPSLDDFEAPTAEAGRPIPAVFGSIEVTGVNLLWWGDKSMDTRTKKSGGKK